MKRNLTVQLDAEVIAKARVLAAKRSTSVSQLVAREIERQVAEDEAYQGARATALHQLDRGFHLGGGGLPDRDSLHAR
jgi:predicted transcriptional regulator